jgi:YD repeat-containing protein
MKIGCLRKRSIFRIMALILVMIAFAIPVSAATYTYDNLGRLTSATTNSGASCTYTYDVGGNLLSGTGQFFFSCFKHQSPRPSQQCAGGSVSISAV